jgi:hypothetical protein
MTNWRKALTWLGFLVGAVALVLQFVISMQTYLANGRDIPGALGMLFSYYTIITNIILVLIYLSELTTWRWLELCRHPVTRGMMAAAMTLVMTFVHFFLRGLADFSGLFLLCDTLLHYATPIIYLVWWLSVARHGTLGFRNMPAMLVPTLIYFLYAMARGAWVREYPCPILNAIKLGYGQVLLNAVYMTIGLGVLVAVVILVDRALQRRQPAKG